MAQKSGKAAADKDADDNDESYFLTLEKKMEIIADLKAGVSAVTLAKRFGKSVAAISKIKKNMAKYEAMAHHKDVGLDKTHKRAPKLPMLDKALLDLVSAIQAGDGNKVRDMFTAVLKLHTVHVILLYFSRYRTSKSPMPCFRARPWSWRKRWLRAVLRTSAIKKSRICWISKPAPALSTNGKIAMVWLVHLSWLVLKF
jgi:hypothetical protein